LHLYAPHSLLPLLVAKPSQGFRASTRVLSSPLSATGVTASRITRCRPLPPSPSPGLPHIFRLLSTQTEAAIKKAIESAPVVLFMKGTPETPTCGFSRASIQILGLQGVDPAKFTAFNVLEDQELRQGKCGSEGASMAHGPLPC
jgi:hypothetical protein